MKRIILTSVAAFIVLLVSCSKDGGLWYSHNWEKLHTNGQSTCDTSAVVSYSATVQPLITANCAISGCHIFHGSALDYAVFSNFVSDCNAPDPNGVMYRLNLPASDGLHMPQNGSSLESCDKTKIAKWIRAGCLNN